MYLYIVYFIHVWISIHICVSLNSSVGIAVMFYTKVIFFPLIDGTLVYAIVNSASLNILVYSGRSHRINS